MRSGPLVAAALLVGALSTGTVVIGDTAKTRQWAVVNLAEPTFVVNTIIQGPVLIVHDAGKMARGGPCTTVYLFEPGRGPVEEIASFHCIPKKRKTVGKLTIRTQPDRMLGFGCVLTEYQFAGDAEGHGVPILLNAQ